MGNSRAETKFPPPLCPPTPQEFKEADLFGTWFVKYAAGNTDTLILRADGTYQQKYFDPYTGENYQSDWKMWSIEQRPSGFIRLHLKGMRRCDGPDEICARVEGGMGNYLNRPVDECEGKLVEMPDEVILIVTGIPSYYKISPLRGLVLRTTRIPGGDAGTYAFMLQPEK